MEQDNQVYVKLQKHLDNQAVGFPATRSGVEIKLAGKLIVDSVRTGHLNLFK